MLNGLSKTIGKNLLFTIAIILSSIILITLNSVSALATAPDISIDDIADHINDLPSISGVASDNESDLLSVELCIHDSTATNYWDGSFWVGTECWLNAAGTEVWSYDTSSIPFTNGSTYMVEAKATDITNESTYASESFTIDSTNPSVTVTEPNGSEFLAGGSTYDITWTATDDNLVENPIKIEYYYGLTSVEIASGEANDGTYQWTVPYLDISNVRIRVTAADKAGNEGFDDSNANFAIDSTNPTVTVIAPNGGEYWAGGSSQTITWTATGDNMNANPITLNYYNGSTWVEIATVESNDGSYGWTVPSLDISNIRVRVTATDRAGNTGSDDSDANFTIDSTDPSVTVTAPNGGEYWTGGSSQIITWTATDANMNDNPITLQYYNGSTWMDIATVESNDGSYDWTVPSLDISNVRVRVTAADKVGNTGSDESDADFAIDSTVPEILINDIADYINALLSTNGSAADALPGELEMVQIQINDITVNKYWDGDSWEATQIWLDTAETAEWSYDTSSITFTNGNTYTVKARSTDRAGNESAEVSDTFIFDTTCPMVTLNEIPDLVNTFFISGTASDDTPGLLDKVQILIMDTNIGTYWNGSFWINGEPWVDAAGLEGWSYSTNSLKLKDGNTYTIRIKSVDKAGNESIEASDSFTYDATCPIVTNVTSSNTDGNYTSGDDIEISVIFSEEVNVTGIPYLELDMGTAVRKAIFESGDGTNTLTFIYTIETGDISSNLDYMDTGSLKLDDGTISDAAGNAAALTLAAPGSEGSLSANSALVIEEEAQDSSLWIVLVSIFVGLGILVVTSSIIIRKQKIGKEKA